MTIRFASNEEIENWDKYLITNPDGGNILQAKAFSDIKAGFHWTPRFIVVDNLYISVLERKVPILGNYWYVPKGPGVKTAEELGRILPPIKNFGKENGVFLIKFEPELINSKENIAAIKESGLIKNGEIQAAANTVIVDTSGDIEEIFNSFSPKTRANIRAAQKTDIKSELVPVSDENCKIFYEMMINRKTGQSFIRNFAYYKNYWQSHEKAGTGFFMFAKSGNEVVSTNFITILGNKAVRKDSASSRDHPIRGASAYLELETIKYLKEKGVTNYDLFGCPPSDQIKNPNHPFYGFGVFKTGFNQNVTDYVGCCDLAIKPIAYKFWDKFGEKITRKLYLKKHHDFYY